MRGLHIQRITINKESITMKRVNTNLMEAIIHNDISYFNTIVNHKEWPHDLKWSQYEMLIFHAFINQRKVMASLLLDQGCSCPVIEDESLMEALFHAIINSVGSLRDFAETIIRCVDRGARVSYQNDPGHTAVHVAFFKKASGKLIDLLLDQYLQETVLNFTDEDSLSVFHIACTRPNLQIVKKFVNADESNINFQVDSDSNKEYAGYTPLHFAVKNGQYEVAEFLLKSNANIYESDANGSTPLHLACYCWDLIMIDLIIKFDPVAENIIDKFGLSHFMVACAGSETVIPREYLRVAKIRHRSSNELISGRVKSLSNCPYAGFTPLHFAAEFGHANTVKLLIYHGADTSALSNQNLTPIQLARVRKHDEVYRLLEKCQNANALGGR